MRIFDALNRAGLVVVTRAWRGGDARPMYPDDFRSMNPSAAVVAQPDPFAVDQEDQP